MRSTFKVLFYVNGSKEKNGLIVTNKRTMAIKSSIHIKPCNISSSEAHNLRTPEYMRNIGKSKIHLIPKLVADNEHWINPRLGDYNLQTHYDNITQMVKAKTGRAMQEKERERKTKSGKIIKVAGYSNK